MKVSLSWLQQYADIDTEASALADMLTMAGLEVEAVFDPYAHLDTVVVGRITDVAPHPDADKLAVCTVDIGSPHPIGVVCGAPNAETGLHTACALPGTELPSGTTVAKGKIRGQVSEGMLCSEAELELGPDADGIMALDAGCRPGQRITDALGLSDTVFEIGLTPNRPDCLSVIGICREISALTGNPLKKPELATLSTTGDIDELAAVAIETPELCPRYAAQMVVDIAVGPSPLWLQKRLLSVGLKPINNIVDITNFVMMETGQPLHAFDYDRLEENRIVVRTPAAGETRFTTLDGKPRELAGDTLLICDGKKPVAVAGVMGGQNSEIHDDTRRVLIESAYFNPVSIRKTAKRLGLATDASHRFERGVDPDNTVAALNRAAALMAELAEGRLIEGVIDVHPLPSQQPTIRLSVEQTNRHLGTRLDRRQMAQYLSAIEFTVTELDADTLEVVAPPFRVDVSRPEDLMEEVARLWGYNNIRTTFPHITAQTDPPKRDLAVKSDIKDIMAGLGFAEAINYSFTDKAAADWLAFDEADRRRNQLPIVNPLSEAQAVMRTSLMPALFESMQKNIFRQEKNLQLFELGKVFFSHGADQLPEEVEMLAGVWTGARNTPSWSEKTESCDFYDIKGAVESLLQALGRTDVAFTQMPGADCRFTRPGHTAQIRFENHYLGMVGEIEPAVLKRFDIKQPAFCFEINVDTLIPLLPEAPVFSPIPKFPATSRDLTVIVDAGVEAAAIISAARARAVDIVEDVGIFDVYSGKPIPEGKKSISIRIVYRSHETTLEDEQVNAVHQEITDYLLQQFAASLPA